MPDPINFHKHHMAMHGPDISMGGHSWLIESLVLAHVLAVCVFWAWLLCRQQGGGAVRGYLMSNVGQVHTTTSKQRLSRQSARRFGYTWLEEAERPVPHAHPHSDAATRLDACLSGAGDRGQLGYAARSLSHHREAVGLPATADGSTNDGLAPSQPMHSHAGFRHEEDSRQGRQSADRLQTVCKPWIGLMASVLQPTAGVAADTQSSGRTGLLWRHKAAVPRPAEQALSWHGAVAAELRRDGSAVAATAQRGGRTLVDGARGVRQTVVAGLPAPAFTAAMPVAIVTGLTAALFILLQLAARLIRSRQRRQQDAPVDDEQLEAAAQRLAQQKARFQNALVDSVDRREAFQPTTYAEILEDYRWMFAQSPDSLDESGFPSGESRANPMYWDEDTRRTWASFVSGSKSMLVRQDAWWDVADVEQRDRRVENVDWNS